MTSSPNTGKKLSLVEDKKAKDKYEVLYLGSRVIGTSSNLTGALKLINQFVERNKLVLKSPSYSCADHFTVREISPTYKLVVKTITSLTLIK